MQQTTWLNDSALLTSDGIVLPCRHVWSRVDTSMLFDAPPIVPQLCCTDAVCSSHSSDVSAVHWLTVVSTRAPQTTRRVCEPHVTPLMDAWFASRRDDATGYRVQPPSLVKMAVRNAHSTHMMNGRPWLQSAARDSSILRVFNAAVTIDGWVLTDNMLLRSMTILNKPNVTIYQSDTMRTVLHARRVLVLHYEWSNFVQHFTGESLPRLVVAADLVARHADIVIAHNGGQGMSWLLPVGAWSLRPRVRLGLLHASLGPQLPSHVATLLPTM
jgi:hypothetical protein